MKDLSRFPPTAEVCLQARDFLPGAWAAILLVIAASVGIASFRVLEQFRLSRRACIRHPSTEKAMPIDPVFVLTVVILAFGGLAAALAWADSQDRGPGNRARCADV